MPIEFWESEYGDWFWTAKAKNGLVVADSAEGYSSKRHATNGALAAAKEFKTWLENQKQKPATKPKAKR